MMPMASEVGSLIRHDYDMKDPVGDGELAAGAQILLNRRVRLDGGHRHPERIAHATTASVATMPMTNMAMSAASVS
jgi:hypothetical protein